MSDTTTLEIPTGCAYQGAGWLKAQGVPMSAFGERVADILGNVYRGIYHIDDAVLKTDWDTKYVNLKFSGYGGMGTVDSCELTDLVIMCHDRCIRCEIVPMSHWSLVLKFSARDRVPSTMTGHPTIEQAIERHRKHFYPHEATK